MSEMLERAVEAVGGIEWEVSPETFRKLGKPQRDHCEEIARAALLAALDPEDEVLVEAVARGMCADLGLHADDWEADDAGAKVYVWHREASTARAALETLKRLAQGER